MKPRIAVSSYSRPASTKDVPAYVIVVPRRGGAALRHYRTGAVASMRAGHVNDSAKMLYDSGYAHPYVRVVCLFLTLLALAKFIEIVREPLPPPPLLDWFSGFLWALRIFIPGGFAAFFLHLCVARTRIEWDAKHRYLRVKGHYLFGLGRRTISQDDVAAIGIRPKSRKDQIREDQFMGHLCGGKLRPEDVADTFFWRGSRQEGRAAHCDCH